MAGLYDDQRNLIPPGHGYYSLDTGEYSLAPPPDQTYIEKYYQVSTADQKKLELFYYQNAICPVLSSPHIDEYSQEDFSHLDFFTLKGLYTKAKVTRVVDPIRLEVIFCFPLVFAGLYKKKGNSLVRNGIITTDQPSTQLGLYMKEKVKLSGLDIKPGSQQIAVETINAILADQKFLVYIRFNNKADSCYLVDIYLDHDRPFKEYLLKHQHPELGFMFRDQND